MFHPPKHPNCNFAQMKKYTSIIFGLILMTLGSCKHEPPMDLDGTWAENCDPDTVYFGNTILPLLVSNCGMSGCHNKDSHREDIILTDYYSIINSDVVEPGHGNSSKLVEVLSASGEEMMPPNPYSALTAAQKNAIRTWINQGAKFNNCVGCDTNYTFNSFILPIIQTYCSGCHSGSSPSGNTSLTDYNQIVAIANSGALLHSLHGTGGLTQMPETKLQDCKILQIQKWIDNGKQDN